MIAILIFIGLIIGMNCIPLFTKISFPKAENVIQKILVVSTTLFLTFTILTYIGYRLKEGYIFSTISYTFLAATFAYFLIFKNTKRKLISIFLLTPLIAVSTLTLLLDQCVYENKINETNKIVVRAGGFLDCGEKIYITQTKFVVFDKDVFHIDNLCLKGINKIETVAFDDKYVELLIYHSGEYDSENPYKYDMDLKSN